MKQAQLADGTILQFPDETPDTVIDKTVQTHVTATDPLAQASTQATGQPVSFSPTIPDNTPNPLAVHSVGDVVRLLGTGTPLGQTAQGQGPGVPDKEATDKALGALGPVGAAIGAASEAFPLMGAELGFGLTPAGDVDGLSKQLTEMFQKGASPEEIQSVATAAGHPLSATDLAAGVKARQEGGSAVFDLKQGLEGEKATAARDAGGVVNFVPQAPVEAPPEPQPIEAPPVPETAQTPLTAAPSPPVAANDAPIPTKIIEPANDEAAPSLSVADQGPGIYRAPTAQALTELDKLGNRIDELDDLMAGAAKDDPRQVGWENEQDSLMAKERNLRSQANPINSNIAETPYDKSSRELNEAEKTYNDLAFADDDRRFARKNTKARKAYEAELSTLENDYASKAEVHMANVSDGELASNKAHVDKMRFGGPWAQAVNKEVSTRAGSGGGNAELPPPSGTPPSEPPSGPEGPSDGARPKYIGNINVDKLGTPEETDQYLQEAVRGANLDPQSHQDTIDQASKLLNDKSPLDILTMDPKQSELPAHGLAVRTLLNASTQKVSDLAATILDPSANTTEAQEAFDKWVTTNAAAGQVASGNAKAAGRYLNSFNIKAGDDEGQLAKAVSQMSQEFNPETRQALAAKVTELRDDPASVQQLTSQLNKPYWEDYAFKLWYNFALSNPKTWVNTAIDNGQQMATRLAELKLSVSPEEYAARQQALQQSLSDAATLFYKNKSPVAQDIANSYAAGHPVTGSARVPIAGVNLGPLEWTSFGPNTISAIDQLYRGIAANMETVGLATRQAQEEGLSGEAMAARAQYLRANPPKDIVDAANTAARSAVYADKMDGPISSLAGKLTARQPGLQVSPTDPSTWANIVPRLGRGVALMVVPFPRVAYNIAKNIVSSSPLGLLVGENARAFKAGGVARDIALARVGIGTGVLAGLSYLASDPNAHYALTPKGLKIGNDYYSLGNTRLGTTAQLVANIADEYSRGATGPKDVVNRMIDLAGTTANDIAENTFFGDTAKFFQLFEKGPEGDYARANFIRDKAASIVPAGVSAVNRAFIDPVRRDSSDSVGAAIQARVPGLSQQLPPAYDSLGQAKTINQNFLTGTTVTTPSPAQLEVDRLSEALPSGRSVIPNAPRTIHDELGNPIKLDATNHQELQRVTGEMMNSAIRQSMQDPVWRLLPDADKRLLIKNYLHEARTEGREEILGKLSK